MKKNYKLILSASIGFLVVSGLALASILRDGSPPTPKQLSLPPPQRPIIGNQEISKEKQSAEEGRPEQRPPVYDRSLQKALAEKNESGRKELLRQWALSVPLDGVRPMIGRLGAVSDKQMRSEAYYALFARWAAEDPVNAVDLMRAMSAAGTL